MDQEISQEVDGTGNIQAGRDVKIFKVHRASAAEAIHVIDGYLVLFYSVMIGCLVATTLPNAFLNILSSLGSAGAVFLVILLHLERRRIAGQKGQSMRRLQSTALVMLTFSILTGCAGPLFSDPTEMAYHCNEINGTACRYGAAEGIGIFGFGLGQVTINAAIEAGHLTKIITTSEVRGYGLISMAKVTVYGE